MPLHPTTTNTSTSNLCQGPYGNSIVLPVVGSGSATSTIYVTSVCNGMNMNNLWFAAGHRLIQTHVVSSVLAQSNITANSWVFYNGPITTGVGYIDGMVFTPPRPRPRVVPAVLRAGRRAVRRSIDIYARFRGMDEVRRFMRGEEIQFEGQLYNYRVRKSVPVLRQAMRPESAHIPYHLRAADKVTGKVLADGCVVFPALPIFDQLLALTFHISDPDDERELVKTTNWTRRLPPPALQAAA